MARNKCLIVLSEKSSGSSAFQELLSSLVTIRHVDTTRHGENETLFWTKAASILGMPQRRMVDSEVPIAPDQARRDLRALLVNNVPDARIPINDNDLIFDGWKALCSRYSPLFLEKSPHHLCQWSALQLILRCMEKLDSTDFLLIGLIRNPMDTIYSQYKRWRSRPEAVEKQWRVAYTNLIELKSRLNDQLVIIRYEDITLSLETLQPVLDFCGVPQHMLDKEFFHRHSIQKWRNDNRFGFALAAETVELAQSFGYSLSDLSNNTNLLWPYFRETSRALYKFRNSTRSVARALTLR